MVSGLLPSRCRPISHSLRFMPFFGSGNQNSRC
ncbi:CRISPR-associated DxTHG motif protein [Ochrobactrum sp. LMG 5442]|nr:CRISPR-associated DxTHG motif protein [Ochrobactrum sp. LMG 5442]